MGNANEYTPYKEIGVRTDFFGMLAAVAREMELLGNEGKKRYVIDYDPESEKTTIKVYRQAIEQGQPGCQVPAG